MISVYTTACQYWCTDDGLRSWLMSAGMEDSIEEKSQTLWLSCAMATRTLVFWSTGISYMSNCWVVIYSTVLHRICSKYSVNYDQKLNHKQERTFQSLYADNRDVAVVADATWVLDKVQSSGMWYELFNFLFFFFSFSGH